MGGEGDSDTGSTPPSGRGSPISTEELDRLLLDRIRTSDPGALDELLERLWAPLVGYATHLLGSVDAAEDVVQESFVRLWSTRRNLKSGSSARAILYRTARNLALDERRKQTVRNRTAPLSLMVPSMTPTPLDVAQASELERSIAERIAALSDRDREIFTLSRFEGLSHAQIGEVLDLAPQTVSNLLHRILSTLKRQLSPHLTDTKILKLPRRRG